MAVPARMRSSASEAAMREELAKRNGRRGKFTAIFVRYGSRSAFRGPPKVTLLFREVHDEAGSIVTDHLWFSECQGWKRLVLAGGEKVAFTASVRGYIKGYFGRREEAREACPPSPDYKLSWPKEIRIWQRAEEPAELRLETEAP